ncbi:polysaccharide deacetylase family protein [Gordonia sp. TBRC 11910]|uniref:Polysaccharide deacetylase family protein n=1 Tax=Gordonia asplenii TaxID=2725283 RepID=A0A848L6L8_9ACTN|nr:polysaccharide deacetylase family protein [Gordonia asplenii]NMO04333.1 polysaccharide deacetylase family protein [Gordonia asplenii]
MEIAITVDELLLWDGTPMPSGYTPHSVMDSLLGALSEHDVAGAYGFAHTAPIEDDPANRDILDRWVDAGHHLGNHTHCHACLNWVTGQQYVDDIKRSEEYVGGYVEKAPTKYFRYAMDMSGESECKRGVVEDHLRAEGYVNAPITAWFGDFAWIAPYCRALKSGDRDAARMLRESYIGAAVGQLVAAHETERRLYRSDVPLIWLIHGTAIAQDCVGEILGRFAELGAEFVSLEQAMASPVNRVMSPVSPLFRNHLQRLAAAVGDEIPATATPEQMAQILTAALPDGDDPFGVYDDLIHRMAARAGGTIEHWSWA